MKFQISGKSINNFSEPYVIAEIGANHNGDMDLAKRMIDSAKTCGADAVKFQSWTPESLISSDEYKRNQQYDDSPKKHFGSLRQMVEEYALDKEKHVLLKEYCNQKKIDFCSTPFSKLEVDLLMELDVPFIKIASMDINYFELIKYAAQTMKPIILSTGMADFSEVDQAIRIIESTGNYQIVLLHCISIYPPNYYDINLNNIPMLSKAFGYPVGFSDHTIGTSIPMASVALGTAVIEKHFTIDKDLPGWDHEISADPDDLSYIVRESKNIFYSLGSNRRLVSDAEINKRLKFRRSLVAAKDINIGTVLTVEMLTAKRPGTGIRPSEQPYVIGRTAKQFIEKDSIIKWGSLN